MGGSKFFPASSHYKRYTKVIIKLIKYYGEDISYYGKFENLESHSMQKMGETCVLWDNT